MARELHTARLTQKICISESAQCFHLEYVVEGRDQFAFTPGQFVSLVREDTRSKLQTRAYSIASAPRANAFDLCVNRVEGGFFSNLLADMEPGDSISFHGPHGLFTLRQPLTDAILIATGTGSRPCAGLLSICFRTTAHRSTAAGRSGWFTGRAIPPRFTIKTFSRGRPPSTRTSSTLRRSAARAADWTGQRGYVQEHVAKIATEHLASDRKTRHYCSRRYTRVQHPRLHLRAERHGFRESGAADRPRLGQEASHL